MEYRPLKLRPAARIDADPSADLRPRAALIIGNGFSRGLLAAADLATNIPTQLWPPPPQVDYLPDPFDRFTKRSLSSPELFPALWNEWESFRHQNPSGDFYSFCERLSSRKAYATWEDGSFRGITNFVTPEYQLRCYLWFLFRFYDYYSTPHVNTDRLGNWEWRHPLRRLIADTRLTTISYNYDRLFENAVGVYQKWSNAPAHHALEEWLDRSDDASLVLKPHGSISHVTLPLIGGVNMWLNSSWVIDANNHGSFFAAQDHHLTRCPLLPDLVPPGHDDEHLANTTSEVRKVAQRTVADSDLLIVCGFSARPPDSDEFQRLLADLHPDALVIHVGLASDKYNDAGRLLRAKSGRYIFIESGKLARLERELDRLKQVIARPSDRVAAFRQMAGPLFNEEMLQRL